MTDQQIEQIIRALEDLTDAIDALTDSMDPVRIPTIVESMN